MTRKQLAARIVELETIVLHNGNFTNSEVQREALLHGGFGLRMMNKGEMLERVAYLEKKL